MNQASAWRRFEAGRVPPGTGDQDLLLPPTGPSTGRSGRVNRTGAPAPPGMRVGPSGDCGSCSPLSAVRSDALDVRPGDRCGGHLYDCGVLAGFSCPVGAHGGGPNHRREETPACPNHTPRTATRTATRSRRAIRPTRRMKTSPGPARTAGRTGGCLRSTRAVYRAELESPTDAPGANRLTRPLHRAGSAESQYLRCHKSWGCGRVSFGDDRSTVRVAEQPGAHLPPERARSGLGRCSLWMWRSW